MELRQKVHSLLAQGYTYSQNVAELGCAKSTVSYHAKNVKEPPNYKVHEWAAVQAYYDDGHGVRDCRKTFGICTAVWYNAVKAGKITTRADYRIPLETLMEPGRGTIRTHLKTRLLSAGVLQVKCGECGIVDWRGQQLSIETHHLNGVNNDNR